MLIQSPGLARRVALALVIGAAAGGLGGLWWACVTQSDVCFLPHRAPADWIIYPSGPKGTINSRLEMSTVFRRSFTLERVPTKALLSVAGLRHCTVSVNGKALAAPRQRGRTWKQPDVFEVSHYLRAGENQVAVEVSNRNGPPVLWLSLDIDGWNLKSDEGWEASYAGAAWRQARLANKPKEAVAGNLLSAGEEPWASLRARWPTLLLFAVISAAAYALVSLWARSKSADHAARPPSAVLLRRTGNTYLAAPAGPARELLPVIVLAGLWVALFINNLGVLPNLAGYDVTGHFAYIRYIQEHHALPRADQGWEMFQPPLYYLLGAGLLGSLSLSVTQDAGVMVLRTIGLVIGVAHLVLVWASLRLLFPGDRAKPRWGLVLAAALPPLLYLSQYVSNEGLAAALVSACVYLTLRMLKQDRVSWKALAGLGLCLGAALLTKATALLVVPAIVGALLLREVGKLGGIPNPAPRAPQHATRNTFHASRFTPPALRLASVLALALLVCGWHYARLWTQYGNPLIGVWDPRLGFSWWQDDGYRTGAFYLRFGAVLAHPWFSSFQGFWDGVYATLWGDGLFGGMDTIARPPWNYGLMAVGYWLALWPSLVLTVGGILALVRFLRQPSAQWFLVLGLFLLAALALVRMSIVLPYQCHVKAFYGLCALVPLCALGAWGLDALCRFSRHLWPALCILFGLWAINSFAAFWVSRSAADTVVSRVQSLWKEERRAEAVELLKAGLERDPQPGTQAQALLAYLLMESGELSEARKVAESAVREGPNEPKGHLVLAALLRREQHFDEATEHAGRAVQLAAGDDMAYEQLASLLVQQGHAAEAIDVAREGLASAPFNADLRFSLGAALASRGEHAEAISQLQLACAIKPNLAGAQLLLGAALAKQGALEEAAQHLREAVRLEPSHAEAHSQLASVLSARHRTAEAVAEYGEALRLEPDFADALNNLAWIRAADPRAEFRNGAEAVRLAERACKVTEFKEPVMVGTLAAAYAEAGRFEDAVAMARKARELALAAGQKDVADMNQKLIELFNARQPYRVPDQRQGDA